MFSANRDADFVNRAQVWCVDWIIPFDLGTEASPRFVPIVDADSTGGSSSSYFSSSSVAAYRHVAETTWNWCAHFVARHSLCPWAEASVAERGAIRIYAVVDAPSEIQLEKVLVAVAHEFLRDLENGAAVDPNSAIALAVLARPSSPERVEHADNGAWYDDFPTFYDWFVDLEERWTLADDITLAPFHPEWKYSYNDDDDKSSSTLELEKQSPFPTITFVSTAIIDKAGPAATKKIAANNEAILQDKSAAEWKTIYNASVLKQS